MYFDVRASGNESTMERTLLKLLQSAAIMTSGLSTIFLPEYSNELYDRIKLLLQKKPAGNNSFKINKEIVAIADK